MISSICVREDDLHLQTRHERQFVRDSHALEIFVSRLDLVICLTKGHADMRSDSSHRSKHLHVNEKHKSSDKEAMES